MVAHLGSGIFGIRYIHQLATLQANNVVCITVLVGELSFPFLSFPYLSFPFLSFPAKPFCQTSPLLSCRVSPLLKPKDRVGLGHGQAPPASLSRPCREPSLCQTQGPSPGSPFIKKAGMGSCSGRHPTGRHPTRENPK